MQTDHTITLPDGRRLTAALALPTGVAPDGGWPGVLVVHEVPSLTPSIRNVADVFATRGWAAVVPDLFSAGNQLGCLVRSIREIRAGRAGAVTADLQQALTWLQNREDVDAGRCASIGFCMGGSFALLLGTLGPDGLRAVSDNYGLLPAPDTDLSACPPVIASFGATDRTLVGAGDTLRTRLDAAGVPNQVHTYDGAAHAFLTSDVKVFGVLPVPGTQYVASAAVPAWQRIFAFLDDHVRS